MEDNALNLIESVLGEVIQESNPRQRFQQALNNRHIKGKTDSKGRTTIKNNPDGDKRLQKVTSDDAARVYNARKKGNFQTGAFYNPTLENKDAVSSKKAYDDFDETHTQERINKYKKLAKDYRGKGSDRSADMYEDFAQDLIKKKTESGRKDKENYQRMLNAIPNATITTNRRGKTKIRYEAAQILIEALDTLLSE